LEWLELIGALVLILFSAELFTNGVEWIGEGFGLPEGAVGSVLAAVGTALPETILPLVAIWLGRSAGKEIGIGAILGAPFMLSTLAMFVLGVAVLIFARGDRRSTDLNGDRRVMLQDLGYFLAMYTLALVAGLLHVKGFNWALAAVLLVGYVFYVKPGPNLGQNQVYWGPEIRWGEIQPALSINSDAVTNVESLSFSYDGISATLFAFMVQIPQTTFSIRFWKKWPLGSP